MSLFDAFNSDTFTAANVAENAPTISEAINYLPEEIKRFLAGANESQLNAFSRELKKYRVDYTTDVEDIHDYEIVAFNNEYYAVDKIGDTITSYNEDDNMYYYLIDFTIKQKVLKDDVVNFDNIFNASAGWEFTFTDEEDDEYNCEIVGTMIHQNSNEIHILVICK